MQGGFGDLHALCGHSKWIRACASRCHLLLEVTSRRRDDMARVLRGVALQQLFCVNRARVSKCLPVSASITYQQYSRLNVNWKSRSGSAKLQGWRSEQNWTWEWELVSTEKPVLLPCSCSRESRSACRHPSIKIDLTILGVKIQDLFHWDIFGEGPWLTPFLCEKVGRWTLTTAPISKTQLHVLTSEMIESSLSLFIGEHRLHQNLWTSVCHGAKVSWVSQPSGMRCRSSTATSQRWRDVSLLFVIV